MSCGSAETLDPPGNLFCPASSFPSSDPFQQILKWWVQLWAVALEVVAGVVLRRLVEECSVPQLVVLSKHHQQL